MIGKKLEPSEDNKEYTIVDPNGYILYENDSYFKAKMKFYWLVASGHDKIEFIMKN